MLLLPPGGACILVDDLPVVGPLLLPDSTLCPNTWFWLDETPRLEGSTGVYEFYIH
jgi:hypothetical protein